MSEISDDYSSVGRRKERLNGLLELLAKQGVSQAQIASRASVPHQYLSDVKLGRRRLSELFARRLGEEFDVNYEWLLGTSAVMERAKLLLPASPASGGVWLPLFPHPISGEPTAQSLWDGSCIELTGAAAAKLPLTLLPYVLRFGQHDIGGRLHRGDLVLISQAARDDAEVSVVQHRKKCFLARRNDDGGWSRVANGDSLPADAPVAGHCLGIIWSAMFKTPS